MSDPLTRRAARVAALVALPAAIVAGLVAYRVLADRSPTGDVAAGGSPRPSATTPVQVTAPALAERPTLVCRALLAKLPDHLGPLARRPVTAGPEQNAAYGDPAVTVACGASGPPPPAGAQFFAINGVCWYAEDGPDARTWVLQGREVPVVVRVPPAYTAQDLVDLAKPIRDAIPEVTPVC
jgi:Protein of unknown function (DUF3515)